MTSHQDALAALSPEQQAAVMAGHEQWVAERQEARRAALEAAVADCAGCIEWNDYGLLRARRLGYEWNLDTCPQCKQMQSAQWAFRTRTYSAAEVEAAA